MTCHLPRTAWQNVWTRPSGSIWTSSAKAKTTPEVPSVAEMTPARTMPFPTAPAAWSPPPPTMGRPARTPRRARGFGGDDGGNFLGLEAVRQQVARDAERGEQRAGPAPAAHVEQQRAGSVGDLGGEFAAQPEADVVLRKEDFPRALVHLRLMPPDPEDFRRGESGERRVRDERDQPPPAARLPRDLLALLAGALVVPENGRAQHAGGICPGTPRRASGRSGRCP